MAGNFKKSLDATEQKATDAIVQTKKPLIGEKLTRNIAIATLLLLCLLSAKDMYIGEATLLRAVQGIVQGEWDDNVGRLTYVGNWMADSLQVFGPADIEIALLTPAQGSVKQAFSQNAPYIVYSGAADVFAAADGEVMAIAHTDEDAYVVRIHHNDGIDTLYYGLNTCLVAEGDSVRADTRIGLVQPGGELAFELRRDGLPIDGARYMTAR